MRKVFAILLASLLLVCLVYPTYAESIENPESFSSISIKDPETGETWVWSVPEDALTISSEQTRSGTPFITSAIEFDATDYLNQTFAANPSGSETLNDDIIITAGLRYSYNESTNKVRLYNAFGSTTNSGMYYASDRVFTWAHPKANLGDTRYPGTSSWNYAVTSTEAKYSRLNKPYATLECRVYVTDMSAYRELTVTYYLEP